jgi:hypothetical protein
MGGYRNEDEALLGLARQLTDAYGEARTREDQDFACDAVAAFLAEFREAAPDEALLAILDLPLTAETYPLVDEAQTALAGRGPAVVKLLLEAALGEVYDPDGFAPERAAEALDMMDRRERLDGLVRVLCGSADDDVKGAAVDGLVAFGAFAEPAVTAALDDADGGDWAQAALEQIRRERAHPPALEYFAAVEDGAPDDASELSAGDEDEGPPPSRDTGADDRPDGAVLGVDGEDPGAGGPAAPPPPEPTGPAGQEAPDQGLVDDAYDEFLRRFREESGGPSSP